jgi:hypothetical protein
VQETCSHCKFIVGEIHIVQTIGTVEAGMSIWNKIPETSLLISAQSIGDIPKKVSMEIHIAELLFIHILVRVKY